MNKVSCVVLFNPGAKLCSIDWDWKLHIHTFVYDRCYYDLYNNMEKHHYIYTQLN